MRYWLTLLLFLPIMGCDHTPRAVVRYDRLGRERVEVHLRGALRDGPVRIMDTLGRPIKEGRYGRDRRTGTWTTRSGSGELTGELNYRNGRLDGRARWWSTEGVLLRDEHYVKGELQGPLMHRFPDGSPRMRVAYVDGEADGDYVRWIREGPDTNTIRLEGQYDHGECTGLWTSYHPNGRIRGQGSFRRNKRVGEWRTWDSLGRLEEVRIFRNGKLVRTLSGDASVD